MVVVGAGAAVWGTEAEVEGCGAVTSAGAGLSDVHATAAMVRAATATLLANLPTDP